MVTLVLGGVRSGKRRLALTDAVCVGRVSDRGVEA